jgi:hypothetical protein
MVTGCKSIEMLDSKASADPLAPKLSEINASGDLTPDRKKKLDRKLGLTPTPSIQLLDFQLSPKRNTHASLPTESDDSLSAPERSDSAVTNSSENSSSSVLRRVRALIDRATTALKQQTGIRPEVDSEASKEEPLVAFYSLNAGISRPGTPGKAL